VGVGMKQKTGDSTCPLPPENYVPTAIAFRSLDNLSLAT
jgi:hypothetical protein